MKVEIICVGTELLLGDIVNTNAVYLSKRLAEMGFSLYHQSVVGDNAERLEKQFSLSLSRSDLVVLTGGLGPTGDDITKETVAKILGRDLLPHADSLRRMEAYFARTNRVMSENNKKQALTISGATVLANDHGTAPGYYIPTQSGAVILLPGPPAELKPMFENKAVPLLQRFCDGTIRSHNVRIFGIGESAVATRCGALLEQENPTVATYAKAGEVDIRVTASAVNADIADALMEPVLDKLDQMFGSHIYGVDVDSLQETVVSLLRKQGKKLATAESCTAGMLSGRITEVPGASSVFEMGVTAYANYVKIQALGVSEQVIAERGAVCDTVAAQMALGIRSLCNADLGVGITGVAGPGESEGKPAGLVYIALADRERVFVRKILCRGVDRENTRILATSTALDMVRRYLQGQSDLLSFGTAIGAPLSLMEGYTLPEYEPPVVAVDPSLQEETNEEEESAVLFASKEPVEPETEKLDIEDNSMPFIFGDDDYQIDTITKHVEEDTAEAEQPKKKNWFLGLFPAKGDPISEKIRKTVFLVAFVVLICTTCYLVNYFVEGWLQAGIVKDAAQTWEDDGSMQKNADGVFIGFESLMEQNSDIRAWIKIDDTNINNPVYQTNDNSYYIDHNMNKESSRYGALFIDKDCEIAQTYHSKNVIVYGHHMRDGTMFGPLKNYTDLKFYKNHSIIDFTTLYREGQYKIFSVFITNTKAEHDDGKVFDYCVTDFAGDDSFMRFVNEVKKRSVIDTGVDVVATDELLTLSTCTYEFDDARLVVVARRIRDDETGDIANTDAAKVNPNPMYPAIWYTKKGLKKPDFSDSSEATSSVASEVSEPTVSDEISSDTTATESGSSIPVEGIIIETLPTETVTSTEADASSGTASKKEDTSTSKKQTSSNKSSSSKKQTSSKEESSSKKETSSKKTTSSVESDTASKAEK